MAEKFKFSLDKLLDIRREKEEESKRLFTESQREKERLKKKLKIYKIIMINTKG